MKTSLKQTPPIVVIRDDREKNPWDEEYLGPGFSVVTARLQTGDYTIKGMQDLVAIEKKSSWDEIAIDISKVKYRENFVNMLRRMKQYPVRILVVESDMGKISMAGLKYTPHITSYSVQGWVLNICLEYGIQLLPVGSRHRAKHTIAELFRRIHEYHRCGRLYYHR